MPQPRRRRADTPRGGGVIRSRLAGPGSCEYIFDYTMPTSIHIPKPLLAAVDRKARALRVSRNRFIIGALQRELSPGARWSPGFFERLGDVDDESARSVDALLAAVTTARRSKRPVRL